jgi:phosphatidylglycerophosphatase C
MTGRRIAAFDFDGTLTQRDTLMGFLARTFGRRTLARAVAQVAPVMVRAKTGRLADDVHHRDASKEALLRELCLGFGQDEFARAGAQYASTLDQRLRPEMTEQLAWHRDAGHELVIVSASLQTYLAPFGEAHGFDAVIGVELEAEHGRLTGRLIGPNVRGPEKAVRLEKWLAGERPELLWAYGNSSGDRELLAMADVPVWVAGRRRTA